MSWRDFINAITGAYGDSPGVGRAQLMANDHRRCPSAEFSWPRTQEKRREYRSMRALSGVGTHALARTLSIVQQVSGF
jgi:hypothetical protein